MNKIKVIFSAWLLLMLTACGNKSGNNESTMESSKDVQLNAIFSKGEVISNNNFEGVAYLQWLMKDTANFDCTLGNVTFEPGCRNSWHSHPGGQILIVLAGEGYYQERGKAIQLIKKGDIIPIKPDIVHWHGATPDSPMEHLAIGTRSNMGPAVWYEPVSDEDYYRYNK